MPPVSVPLIGLRALSRYAPRASRTIRSLCPLSTHKPFPRIQPLSFRRFNSTTTEATLETLSETSSSTTPAATSKPLTDRLSSSLASNDPNHPNNITRPGRPEYLLTFTCDPCGTRSSHKVSKQGYHHGSTLITCPECRNRHVISDHLNIFGDRNMTIEDLMRERGQLVKKGTLSEDGDLEFWEDGTTTKFAGKEGEQKGEVEKAQE